MNDSEETVRSKATGGGDSERVEPGRMTNGMRNRSGEATKDDECNEENG